MRSTKLYAGIDYHFRPESYWVAARNPLEAALRNVKGRNRREMIRDYEEAGILEQLHDNLLADTLDDQKRQSLGQIHPSFMGGEYLPNYDRSEVEIARIEHKSTTYDVISLRARPIGSRIKYRLVDEYSSEFRLPQQTSSWPFSLGELNQFLDSVEQVEVSEPSWIQFGFVLSSNQCNLECGTDLETLRDFTREVGEAKANVNRRKIEAYRDPRLFALNLLGEQISKSAQPLVPERVLLFGQTQENGGASPRTETGGLLPVLLGLLVSERSGLNVLAPNDPQQKQAAE